MIPKPYIELLKGTHIEPLTLIFPKKVLNSSGLIWKEGDTIFVCLTCFKSSKIALASLVNDIKSICCQSNKIIKFKILSLERKRLNEIDEKKSADFLKQFGEYRVMLNHNYAIGRLVEIFGELKDDEEIMIIVGIV